MTTLLVSHHFNTKHGAETLAGAARHGARLELMVLPPEPAGRLPDSACARAEIAFFSEDVFPDYSRQFFSAARKAPGLKWMHVFNVGVDHPIYSELLARGVRLTTSAGTTAGPIAQTAIAGMLMLARNFPRWIAAQRRRAWDPMRGAEVPRDLRGQTMLVLGLGHIGNEIARLARLLGLHVVGVRRGGPRPGDAADELHAPDALPKLLPRADWLAIACSLTTETQGLVNAARIAALPRGARIVNVSRGKILVQEELIAALGSGHLAGAYLDVFDEEPLPPDSPLWELPNVIVTPHNSAASDGNGLRVNALFLENLARWHRGEPLINEVHSA